MNVTKPDQRERIFVTCPLLYFFLIKVVFKHGVHSNLNCVWGEREPPLQCTAEAFPLEQKHYSAAGECAKGG